jgi:hypothetical protein
VVRQLIVKDLYLARWLMVGAVLGGLGALAIMPLSVIASYVSSVSLICTLIILNIFLVMFGISQEKKDKVQLFFLSLPVSTTEYTMAKMLGNAIAFVVPWTVLTIATLVVIDVTALPNGLIPYWSTLLVYMLSYYFVLLSVAMVTDSTGWHATTITIGNISINFLIPLLLSLPSVAEHRTGSTAVWTPDITAIIAIEIGIAVAAVSSALYVRSRTADFV